MDPGTYLVSGIHHGTFCKKITAGIAVWMAEFLTSGFLILIAVMIVIYLIVKLKWKIRRHLRDW